MAKTTTAQCDPRRIAPSASWRSLSHLMRTLIGAVFLYAAFSKAFDSGPVRLALVSTMPLTAHLFGCCNWSFDRG